jgi:hypothetical protein
MELPEELLPAGYGDGNWSAADDAMWMLCPYLCCESPDSYDSDEVEARNYPSFPCDTANYLSLTAEAGMPEWMGRVDLTVPVVTASEVSMVSTRSCLKGRRDIGGYNSAHLSGPRHTRCQNFHFCLSTPSLVSHIARLSGNKTGDEVDM